ncbi:MAG: 30S ribosomal protein S9 [Candidatus Sericytochromatia bacterium]|nr:MAG: 30S ribosomal protein S9 [Candidatus Sericytochromatia bacterium]
MDKLYYWGTGRRKTAVARVRIKEGKGAFLINNRDWKDYIGNRRTLIEMLKAPLEAVNQEGKYDIYVNVNGGGVSSQAGAIRHGLSRALLEVSEDFRAILKPLGFLTRDPRMKERKKPGQKRARKRFQFSKR